MSYVTHTLDINEDNIHWTSGFYGETSSHAFVSQELVSPSVHRADLALTVTLLSPERHPRRERCRQRRFQHR